MSSASSVSSRVSKRQGRLGCRPESEQRNSHAHQAGEISTDSTAKMDTWEGFFEPKGGCKNHFSDER